jgi:cell division protein FtsQ
VRALIQAQSSRGGKRRGAKRNNPSRHINWAGILRRGGTFMVIAGALGVLAWQWDNLNYWPVRNVAISGAVKNVSEQDVREQLLPYMNEGLVALPLDQVRDSLRSLAWVDDARVSRVWPDGLAVIVTEQQPTARWGDNSLLNYRGEVFIPPVVGDYAELTSLYGPKGSEQEVMATYQALSKVLGQRNMQLRSLRQDQRGAWYAQLEGELVLRFGSEDLPGRIRRFIAVFDRQLALYRDNIASVDLRYHNGLAVAWKTPLGEQKTAQEG